jgi:Tfp pilus assembly protein PilO
MSKLEISPKLLAGVSLALVALVAAIGWFALVSPQHSKANSLDRQIADGKVALVAATESLAKPAPAATDPNVALKALGTALPSTLEMPSVLRQVQHLASTSSVSLTKFTPSTAVALLGYEAVPIDISVTGRYGQIQGFLHGLRVHAQLTSRGGIEASGRLFSVESVGLAPGTPLTKLTATIRVDAFVLSAPAPAATTTTNPTAAPAAAAGGTPS